MFFYFKTANRTASICCFLLFCVVLLNLCLKISNVCFLTVLSVLVTVSYFNCNCFVLFVFILATENFKANDQYFVVFSSYPVIGLSERVSL